MKPPKLYLPCYSPGMPLYADKSKVTGGKKFGEVVEKVLLPLALDYHVRSRDVDVNALAADQLSNLNGAVDKKNDAIKVWLIGSWTLYSPVSVCIFSIVVSVHFPWYWQYINQELILVADHFLCSRGLDILFLRDTLRRSSMLVALGGKMG